jgi:RNA polymerase sigma-70 factor, ECF subfamily
MLAVRHKRSEFERQALVHADALYGAAYRLTRNPRDAEDLVQDALLRAYKFWDSFQQDSNCKAWLLRIVTNTFINEYQRRKRSREVLDAASAEQDATDGVLVHASAGDKQSPDQAMLAASVSDDVQRALEQLPDDFRTAVILCDMQGLSYKEIAEIMETPVGTVMSRLFRGRKLLAAALKEFALAEGYVKSDAASEARPARGRRAKGASSGASDATIQDNDTNNETIDLEKYRAAKTAREGSR